MDMSLSKLRELMMDKEAFAIHGVAKRQTWLSDWTELNWKGIMRLALVNSRQMVVASWWMSWSRRDGCLRLPPPWYLSLEVRKSRKTGSGSEQTDPYLTSMDGREKALRQGLGMGVGEEVGARSQSWCSGFPLYPFPGEEPHFIVAGPPLELWYFSYKISKDKPIFMCSLGIY